MFYIFTGLLGFLLSGIWYATNDADICNVAP